MLTLPRMRELSPAPSNKPKKKMYCFAFKLLIFILSSGLIICKSQTGNIIDSLSQGLCNML
jgi:hypothetical protein